MTTRTFTYPSSDGEHACFAKEWLPDRETPKAIVQIVHGIAEYVERYDDFAQFLAENGYMVVGEDHLGHGKTAADGKYGRFAEPSGWDLVLKDIQTLRDIEKKEHPGVPYVMLGHSMGSFLLRHDLIRNPGNLDAAIISGTGDMSSLLVGFGRWYTRRMVKKLGYDGFSPLVEKLSFGTYNKQFEPARTKSDWISSDTAIVDAYMADPLCQFPITVGLSWELVENMPLIASRKNMEKMDKSLPIYFFSGDKDPVGDSGKGVQRLYDAFRAAGMQDVQLKLYPEGRHEMLNEVNRAEVYADVLAWLEAHVPA